MPFIEERRSYPRSRWCWRTRVSGKHGLGGGGQDVGRRFGAVVYVCGERRKKAWM